MVKSHEKHCQNYFLLQYLNSHRNVEKISITDTEASIKKRVMDFDDYEKYLTCISNKTLLRQS